MVCITIISKDIGYGNANSDLNLTRAEVVETNARKEEIVKTLNEFNGNKRKAAVSLGISEATLYRWLKKLNLNKILSAQAFREKLEVLT